MPTDPSTTEPDVYEFALGKMSKVLGQDRSRQLMEKLLRENDIELRSPQDLLRLSEVMSGLGGFEGAVGAMLGVAAVLRGASPTLSGRGV